MSATHDVGNQPPPLTGYDVFAADAVLVDGIQREGAGDAHEFLSSLGTLAGNEPAQHWGVLANTNPPVLRTHDRYGFRIDEVEFHPAWHELLTVAVGHGLAGAPWRDPRPAPHVVRAAGFYVWSQVEGGHGCPVSMTYAAVPVLRMSPDLATTWE